jgi:hypothetical protein
MTGPSLGQFLHERGHDHENLGSRMTGEGLEPSTNGLTYLIGFRQPHHLP